MPQEPEFIARVEKATEKEIAFCGSAFLISPRYLLTCAHVALGTEPARYERWVAERIDLGSPDVCVTFPNGLATGRRRGRVVAYGNPDIALVRLEDEVSLNPVRLVAHLSSHHQNAIRRHSGLVAGFAAESPNSLTKSPIDRIVDSPSGFWTSQLRDLQLEGGRNKGISGGPALIYVSGQWLCFGMVRLGGEGAATSRLILADALIDLLNHQQIVFPEPLRADDCLSWTLGAFLADQRESLKLTCGDVASHVGVPEAVVRDWESGDRTPTAEYRGRLRELLIDGNPLLEEEWSRLLVKMQPAIPPVDFLSALRPFAAEGALRVEKERGNPKWRGIGTGQVRPWRARFEMGSYAQVYVDLPFDGYATFLEIQRLESVERFYVCLDPLLGSPQRLSRGKSVLPAGSGLPVGGPVGRYCLVALARKSEPFGWRNEGATHPMSCWREAILPTIESLVADEPRTWFIALFEYEVSDSELWLADPWDPPRSHRSTGR